MGKARIPQGRAAFYRLQAELARRKADTMAEIEEGMTGHAPEDKDP
jgi:hypothetical protein